MPSDANPMPSDPPGLPDGYRLRTAKANDAAAIADMICEESLALVGFRAVSADFVATRITKPGYDADSYAAVIEAGDGAMVGFLQVDSDPPHSEIGALGATAIAHHGRGIGAFVVADNERRARLRAELAAPGQRVVIHAGTLADEPHAAALLTRHGYSEVRRFGLMRLVFDGAPPEPQPPAGVIIDRLRPGSDEPALYAMSRDAFADHWGEGWPTYDVWLHEMITGEPGYDPALWFVARSGTDVIGQVVSLDASDEDPHEGYITDIAVSRDWRRRGVGEALLRTAIRTFFDLGKTGVSLHVDEQSLTGATRLYQRVGMRMTPRYAQWEKELRPAASR